MCITRIILKCNTASINKKQRVLTVLTAWIPRFPEFSVSDVVLAIDLTAIHSRRYLCKESIFKLVLSRVTLKQYSEML